MNEEERAERKRNKEKEQRKNKKKREKRETYTGAGNLVRETNSKKIKAAKKPYALKAPVVMAPCLF